ncbi:MAG: VWA domain-containing protein [Gammaproteobacteria bacterium]|nr:VWA domain-containing protein [Gammaproteobacteria bacterium]
MTRLPTTLLLILLAGFGLPAAATDDKKPLDAVLIMDSSGSMKSTDPKELRKPAAKLFITLLGKQDQLGVMSFSDNAYPITWLTTLDTQVNKTRALQATDKISSKGAYTNIHAAIARGIDLLKESDAKGREPIIVLMSDGKMDVGDNARSAELRKKIMDELMPLIKQYKIKIYSIAFTEQSDQELLQEIADASEGRYALAATDSSLHKAFTKIFEQSKEPNMLPLTENQFVVDASVREITILANKKTEQSKIFLESPGKVRYNAKAPKESMQWFESADFEMITISKPEIGDWKILFSDNDNKAYIVADIELRSRFAFNSTVGSQALSITAWLKKNEDVVRESDLLKSMEVKLIVEHPDGSIEKMDFPGANADGQYITQFTPTQDGIYAATLTATSKTFQRQQVFSFRSNLPAQTASHKPVEHTPEPVAETPVKQQPAEPVKTDDHAVTQPPEEIDIAQAAMIFVTVNVVLILIGVNVYFFLRSRKKKSAEQ